MLSSVESRAKSLENPAFCSNAISPSNFRMDQLLITFVVRHLKNTELEFSTQRTTFNMADLAVNEVFTSALSLVLQKQESVWGGQISEPSVQ